MKQGRVTPAVAYLILFILGFCLQMAAAFPFWLLFLCCALAVILSFCILRPIPALLCICVLLSGMLRYETAFRQHCDREFTIYSQDSLQVDVLSVKAGPYFISSYVLKVNDGFHSTKAILHSRLTTQVLQPGRRYSIKGAEMQTVEKAVNPFVFDYHRYCRQKGISHVLKPGKYSLFKQEKITRPIRYLAYRVSEDISIRFLCILGIEKGSIVNGMLLGRKSEIPAHISSMFRELGISHLLAVSGLHVGLIVIVMMQIVSLFPLPIQIKPLLLIFFLIFYCFLTGGTPSVVRSSLMTGFLLFSPLLHRKYDALNAVAVSALILLFINPFYIQDVGFQYSYAAVCGILLLYQKLSGLTGKWTGNAAVKYLLDILLVSVCASLFTAPVSLIYFNTLPLLALFLNILVIPLTFVLMITAVLSLPFIYFQSFAGDLVLNCLDFILEIFRALLRLASRSQWWTLSVDPSIKLILLTFLLISLILLLIEKPLIKYSLALSCLLLGLSLQMFSARPEFILLQLKKGSCILVNDKNMTLVINTGTSTYYGNDYERSIKPVLDHWGSDSLTVIITEPGGKGVANFNRIKKDHNVKNLLSFYPLEDWENEHILIADEVKFAGAHLNLQIEKNDTKISVYAVSHSGDSLKISAEKQLEYRGQLFSFARMRLRRQKWRKQG